ncbi:MAG: hypothetical protein LBF22_05760, partial [Deltaproteobacteria bacterium]|nr:hypothetical protein [Deltaproteobacteria bacterium]
MTLEDSVNKIMISKGPYYSWAEANNIDISGPFEMPNHPENVPQRGEGVKILFSRLPEGLRVFSVSRVNNYSLACSVVVTCSKNTIENVCREAGIRVPNKDAFFCHVSQAHKKINKDSQNKSIIFRRTGPDVFLDGTENPSPWARLEIRFFIKMPNEVSMEEKKLVADEMIFIDEIQKNLEIPETYLNKLFRSGFGLSKSFPKEQAIISEIKKKCHYKILPYGKGDATLNDDYQKTGVSLTTKAYRDLISDLTTAIKEFYKLAITAELFKENLKDTVAEGLEILWELSDNKTGAGEFCKLLWENFNMELLGYKEPITGLPLDKWHVDKTKINANFFEELATFFQNSVFLGYFNRALNQKLQFYANTLPKVIERVRKILFLPDSSGKKQINYGLQGFSQERIDTLDAFVNYVMKPFSQYPGRSYS